MSDKIKEVPAKEECKKAKFNGKSRNKSRAKSAQKQLVAGKQGVSPAKWAQNDVAWYRNYPQLIDGAANVIQNYIPGTLRPCHGTYNINAGNITYDALTVPACASVSVALAPGKCDSASSGFNMQMKALWLLMHRKYRGIGTYEYSDLGITLFCILNVYALLACGERAYGIYANYKVRNRNVPMAIAEAIHWNISSLAADAANFRFQLNRLITKAKTLVLPKGLAAVEDVTHLFSNVFKDRDSARAQFFVYNLKETFMYSPTALSSGGCAIATTHTFKWTTSSFLARLEAMIDALLLDDDVARQCSDILAAFDENELQSMLLVPEDYMVEPVYNEMRNLQFHNIKFQKGSPVVARRTTISGWNPATMNVVYQNNGSIEYIPCRAASNPVTWQTLISGSSSTLTYPITQQSNYSGTLNNYIYDGWKDTLTDDDVIELTRFSNLDKVNEFVGYTPGGDAVQTIDHGLYIVENFDVFTMDPTSKAFDKTTLAQLGSTNLTSDNEAEYYLLSAFDNAPFNLLYDDTGYFITTDTTVVQGQVDNIVFIPDYDVIVLHDTCILSEFTLIQTKSLLN